MTVKLVHQFYHPKSVRAWAEGGIHALDNGNYLIGYGVVLALQNLRRQEKSPWTFKLVRDTLLLADEQTYIVYISLIGLHNPRGSRLWLKLNKFYTSAGMELLRLYPGL